MRTFKSEASYWQKNVDVAGLWRISFKVIISQILRSLSWPCLRLQIMTGPYAEWFVSYPFLDCRFHSLWQWVVPYAEFRQRAHGGCDQSAEDICASMAPDPTFAVFVLPHIWFCICLLDYDCVWHINFPTLYCTCEIEINSFRIGQIFRSFYTSRRQTASSQGYLTILVT
jgi:hypothetical protein